MCGILGFVKTEESGIDTIGIEKILEHLYSFSEVRGHDSSGIAVMRDDCITVNKRALSASKYLKTKEYKQLIQNPKDIQAIIAHARMETNGSFSESINNQPVIKDSLVTVHNGIIVNDIELWKKNPRIKRANEVDTEIFNSLVSFYEKESGDLLESVKRTLSEIKGSYSFATLFSRFNYLLLATNTGSLYFIKSKKFLIFASESNFLEELIKKYPKELWNERIEQLKPKTFVFIEINNIRMYSKLLSDKQYKERRIREISSSQKEKTSRIRGKILSTEEIKRIENYIDCEYKLRLQKIRKMKRCTKCIVPETMPYIEFDKEGVCNYCRSYKKITLKGEIKLQKELSKYKSKDGSPDCIMAFSGGRDSSYALHFLKKEMGMHPIAYSYDWGMLTDLGRRNQARMTGQLGVEHILVSADIQRKRENIRMNINAWLKRPHLGTIPLFMAGDKQYFYYANLISKQKKLDLVVISNNLLEVTHFKTGFCGISPKVTEGRDSFLRHLNFMFKLFSFYGKEYFMNPAYANRSLIDSLGAFGSYYVIPHNLLSFYTYVKWDEKEIENVLTHNYDWEMAQDTNSSWRIGDGTASFYNYIYYMVAGFTEVDTFRSAQIRENMLSREDALLKSEEENKPRVESLVWYTNTIGIDFMETLKIVNSIKTLY